MTDTFVSASEVARSAGLSPEQVRRLFYRGALPGKVVAGRILIETGDALGAALAGARSLTRGAKPRRRGPANLESIGAAVRETLVRWYGPSDSVAAEFWDEAVAAIGNNSNATESSP